MSLLISWFPMILFIGVWIFFMRQMQGGGAKALSFGKARARLISEKHNKVTFVDVAGVEEAKEELREIIEFLKDPQKFQKLGGKIPKGVLLVGPPGTGKTLLAKAIAGEANVPFFSISGSDFVEMFVGVGASRVRDLFEQGKKHAPCIIFMDEIDAVGRHRGAGLGGGHDEREQTLNQLLVEMDGAGGGRGGGGGGRGGADPTITGKIGQAKNGLSGTLWPTSITMKAYADAKTDGPKALSDANALFAKAAAVSASLAKYNFMLTAPTPVDTGTAKKKTTI